jgi:hypothetical protein
MNPWGGNSSLKTCYGRTKTALVGLLGLVLKRFAGSKTHLIGKNMGWLAVQNRFARFKTFYAF